MLFEYCATEEKQNNSDGGSKVTILHLIKINSLFISYFGFRSCNQLFYLNTTIITISSRATGRGDWGTCQFPRGGGDSAGSILYFV